MPLLLKMDCTYVNGEKITGKIKIVRGGSIGYADSVSRIPMGDMSVFRIRGTIDKKSIFSPDFGGISMDVPYTDFGDTEAADVAVGKTFTSAAGLLVVGTKV